MSRKIQKAVFSTVEVLRNSFMPFQVLCPVKPVEVLGKVYTTFFFFFSLSRSCEEQSLVVEWDTEENIKAIRSSVALLLRGCSCKKGYDTWQCSCKRTGKLARYSLAQL